jgi:hypothetical protein
MSHLNEMATQMADKEMLIRALVKHMHLNRQDIEVHDRAQRINGYHSEDNFVGHVIVRKGKSGIPSDIGWEFKNGNFVGHVDSYNYSSWGPAQGCNGIILDEAWNTGLQDVYNQEVLRQGLTDKGIAFKESKSKDGYPVFSYRVESQPQTGIIL